MITLTSDERAKFASWCSEQADESMHRSRVKDLDPLMSQHARERTIALEIVAIVLEEDGCGDGKHDNR
jgi:hypothetical protein